VLSKSNVTNILPTTVATLINDGETYTFTGSGTTANGFPILNNVFVGYVVRQSNNLIYTLTDSSSGVTYTTNVSTSSETIT
jgi:hypothetical protein